MNLLTVKHVTHSRQPLQTLITLTLALALALGLSGLWRAIPAYAAEGINYYVDCSATSDGNGTSQSPWNNLNDVNTFNSPNGFHPGDHILFQPGTTCNGQLHPLGSGNATDGTITIDQNGSGAKPKIDGQGTVSDVVYLYNQQYWDINNLEITNDAASPAKRTGVHVINATAGVLTHIHISGMNIHNIRGYVNGYFGQSAGVSIQVNASDAGTAQWTDVVVQNNTITTVDRLAVFVGPESDAALPKTLKTTNIDIKNNTINDMGGDDILVYNVAQATVEGNIVTNGGARLDGAPCPPPSVDECFGVAAAIFTTDGDHVTFQHNTVINQENGGDGEAFDSDSGSTYTTFQYNYTANNSHGAYVFYNYSGDPIQTIVRDNISQNDGNGGSILHRTGDAKNTHIYNNTFFVPATSNATFSDDQFAPSATVTNNIIADLGTGALINGSLSPNGTWDHNLITGSYANTATGDAAEITSDPLLDSSGSGGTTPDTLQGYALQPGSPALPSGVVISNNGGQDFFGNPVSSTAAPNRGAYNGPAVQNTGFNLARGKATTASSTAPWCGCYAPTSATDGDLTSFWTSQLLSGSSANEYITVDLGSQSAFDRVVLFPRFDSNGNAIAFPLAFQIAGSNDNSANATWTPLVTQTTFPNPTSNAAAGFGVGNQSFRYVRVMATTVRTDGANYYFQLAEVEVYHNAISTAKSATASSTAPWCGCYAPTSATDGDLTSFWTSQLLNSSSANESITIDLGSQSTFDRVVLYPRFDNNGNASGFPSAFQIVGSNDNSANATWTPLVTQTNFPNPANAAASGFGVGNQAFRYVRIIATTVRTDGVNYYFQLAEVEVQNS